MNQDALLPYRAPLDEGLSAWGLNLPDSACEKLCRYLDLIARKNEVMNLTTVTEPGEMVRRHLLDSLSLLKTGLLPQDFEGSLIDVGTGAGLPGVPLAVALPGLQVTLLDSLGKRVEFLNEVIAALDIPNAATCLGRAEELARGADLRERFTVATARAVADLRVLAEYCLPYVQVGGRFLPLKGGDLDQELQEARPAIAALGGRLDKVARYEVPGEGVPRCIPVIRKTAPCEERFPRRQSRIAKNPL